RDGRGVPRRHRALRQRVPAHRPPRDLQVRGPAARDGRDARERADRHPDRARGGRSAGSGAPPRSLIDRSAEVPMPLIAGVPAETAPGERRVALTPDAVKALVKDGIQVAVQAAAGHAAGFDDASYAAAGAKVSGAAEALSADLVLKVAAPSEAEIAGLREGGPYIGFLAPVHAPADATP